MARRRRPPRAGALTELPPLKIISQMAILQVSYYAAALVLMVFTALVYGKKFSMEWLFGWEPVRGDTTMGWLMAFTWLVDGALVVSLGLTLIVARSKLVPDFAISLHAIHLIVTTFYTGRVPRSPFWWLTMAASSAAAVGLGMWGCQYRELRPMFFGGGRSSANASGGGNGEGSSTAGGGTDGPEDEEHGFSRGRGRGRGRDSRGEYEMMKMNGNTD
ncbi:hypothetical protein MCOR25_001571 [Pyricularia grisea]|nr:hypothetical protein MCOR25_001571 [Pyricularia grisea]